MVTILSQLLPFRRSTTAVSQISSASVSESSFPEVSGCIPFKKSISERYTFPIPAMMSCLSKADPNGSDVLRILSANCFFPRFPSRNGSGPSLDI